jgi:hypothetical protein
MPYTLTSIEILGLTSRLCWIWPAGVSVSSNQVARAQYPTKNALTNPVIISSIPNIIIDRPLAHPTHSHHHHRPEI